MKHMKRANIYQTSNYNCTFNPKSLEAKSYKWWMFVAKIDNKVIFNSYRYSVSTSKHQSKVRSLMQDLGIKIDVELKTQSSLTNYLWDLQALYVSAEEEACNSFLREEEKKIGRNERAAKRREVAAIKREMDCQREEKTPYLSLVSAKA